MRATLVLVGLLSLSSGTIKQADQVFQGHSPTGSGQVACATAADAATWQAPTSCSLVTPASNYWTVGTYLTPQNITTPENVEIPATGSTTAAPTIMGFDMPSAGQAVELQMGDGHNGLWNAYAERMMLVSYHGIEIHGASGSAAPTWVGGGGTADPSMTIFSGGGGGALRLDATAGGNALTVASGLASVQALTANGNFTATAGTNSYTGTVSSNSLTLGTSGAVITGSYKGTTSTLPSVSASSCANLATHITVTNAATGSVCAVGLPSGFAASLMVECWADGAGTVQIKFCNPTAGSITPTAGTYTVRVIQ